MEMQKLNVKLFLEAPHAVPLAAFIEIFHGWIQTSDGIYHDIADYSHMHAGPGVVLVARNANLSIDESDLRRGLLYSQKSPLGGTNQEKLLTVLRTALEHFRKLEREPKLAGKFKLLGNEAWVAVNDRLTAPHTEESFAAAAEDIGAVARRLFGEADTTVERERDGRRRFAVQIKGPRRFTVDELLQRLSCN